MAPAWLRDAVFYEIYPQSFYDTNGDGIGDLKGITEKLPYVKSLGCNALWLNPFYDSPFQDAGYDVRDFKQVAARYGTKDDLKQLLDTAHSMGIRVLFDLVPGHTSAEHPWFKASCEEAPNDLWHRYIWTDCAFTRGDTMPFIGGQAPRNGTFIVNYFAFQPALNYGYSQINEPAWQMPIDAPAALETREAMKDIMRYWLSFGCDGFRVDMADSLVKNDPDAEGTIALWQKVFGFLSKEFPEAAMVSEWGEPDKSLRGGFHMDFLLHFGPSHYNDLFRCDTPYFAGTGDASAFVEKYLESRKKGGPDGLICIPSGNHDMDRLPRALPEAGCRIAFAFLLTMPGAPFIYYGDEIGMRHVEGLTSVEGGYNRTGARSPMQWDHGVNAGFSAAPSESLYISQDPDPSRPTVADQLEDPGSQLHQVKQLIALRQAHPALQNRSGIRFLLDGAPGMPLVYERFCDQERLLIVLNPGKEAVTFSYENLLGEAVYTFGSTALQENGTVTAAPVSAGIYRIR